MAKLKQLWIDIKTSFWFIPAVVNIILILLAFSVIEVDKALAAGKHQLPFTLMSFQQESIRTFLATISASMMTIAGVVFSVTILVLAQTAGQYTSRVLKNFMRKKMNQFVLGLFVGIFIFCLLLISNLHVTDNALTALSGFIIALLGVGFLIYYIHQISVSIQSIQIIRSIYDEINEAICRLFPDPISEKQEEGEGFDAKYSLCCTETGYLQAIDYPALVELAKEKGVQIEILKTVGDFIANKEAICLCTKDPCEEDGFAEKLFATFVIGKVRTAEQDIGYGIQQISDIALRGLSPGMNDLSTAKVAIEYLSSVFIQLGDRDLGSSVIYLDEKPTIHCKRATYSSLLEIGLKGICHNARNQPTIQDQINESMNRIKKSIQNEERIQLVDSWKVS